MSEDTGRWPADGAGNGPGHSEAGITEDQGNPTTQQMRAVGRRRREAEEKLRQAMEHSKDDSTEDGLGQ